MQVAEFLARQPSASTPDDAAYSLVSPDGADRVAVPAELHQVLLRSSNAMSQGLAVTITPQTLQLTTQQAADLLGISRPTLIKLLDNDQIPHQRIGTHRRLQLRDVLDYREQRRAAQYAALKTTAMLRRRRRSVETVLADLQERTPARPIAEQRRHRTA